LLAVHTLGKSFHKSPTALLRGFLLCAYSYQGKELRIDGTFTEVRTVFSSLADNFGIVFKKLIILWIVQDVIVICRVMAIVCFLSLTTAFILAAIIFVGP
jgi:hypothetical protein